MKRLNKNKKNENLNLKKKQSKKDILNNFQLSF